MLGVAFYLAYTYAIFAFSVAANALTAVYIAILGLSVWGAVMIACSLDATSVEGAISGAMHRRAIATFLVIVAMLFGLLWLGQLGAIAMSSQPPTELAKLGLPSNPVYALDLAFFLPACVVTGIGLQRNWPFAFVLAPPLLVFAALMGGEILCGFIFAAVAGDEVPATVLIVVGGIVLVAASLAWRSLRSVLGSTFDAARSATVGA